MPWHDLWQQNSHDASGNVTYHGVYQYRYHAWNRLVRVTKAYRDTSGDVQEGSVVQELSYDGQGRRIVQRIRNSGDLNATYRSLYAGQSVVEVNNGSSQVARQKVWAGTFNVGYIDQLIQVRVADPVDFNFNVLNAPHWALTDANYNLLALVDESGDIVERYEYTPYGQRQIYVSAGLNDLLATAPVNRSPRRTWSGGSAALPWGLNEVGHQGLMHDEGTGLVYNRTRMLHSVLGRFVQRDPLNQNEPSGGYQDGMGLYQYVRSNPVGLSDSLGLHASGRPCGNVTILRTRARVKCPGDWFWQRQDKEMKDMLEEIFDWLSDEQLGEYRRWAPPSLPPAPDHSPQCPDCYECVITDSQVVVGEREGSQLGCKYLLYVRMRVETGSCQKSQR